MKRSKAGSKGEFLSFAFSSYPATKNPDLKVRVLKESEPVTWPGRQEEPEEQRELNPQHAWPERP